MSIINAIESGDNTELASCLREIYRRAMTDADFRETALNDPEAAFEAVGGSLKNWNVKFVDAEEGIDDVFMLPPSVDAASELSEEELEAVAGGALDPIDYDESCCTITSEGEVMMHQ
jgi:hypothetical protein